MKLHFRQELDQPQKNQWEQFWYKCQHSHPRQHFLFGQVERAKGRIPIYIYGESDGTIVCAGVFSIRPFLWSRRFSFEAICQRGPIFDNPGWAKEFLYGIEPLFKSLMVGSIRVAPYWFFPQAQEVSETLNELGYSTDLTARGGCYSTGLVDIQRSDEDIFRSLSESTRREIRRAGRQNVTIRPASNLTEAETFFQYLGKMSQERGIIPVSYDEFTATFQHILEKRQLGVLLNAFGGEMFLGGLWIVRGPTTAHTARYVVAPKPLRELSNLSIGPVLWWSGIKWAKEKGCSWLDVEGYADNADPSNEKYLVYEFKKKFSPQPAYGLGHYIRVCQPFIYSVHKSFNFLSRGWRSATGLPYKIKKKMSIPNLRREST